MMRRLSGIGAFLTLWVLVPSGCAQEESEPVITPVGLIAQQCAAVIRCGCAVGSVDDVEACIESLSGSVESTANAAEAAGLMYDADCAARQVAFYDELGCSIQNDDLLLGASCALSCQLYYGYAGPGEECTVLAPRASNCAAGLECVGGTCQDVCNNWRLAEGATCYDPINPPTGSCVTGTHCDVGDTNRCVVTPKRGEPCPGNVCLAGDFCNSFATPEATCEAIKEVGQSCLEDSACATGYCIDNSCAPYPNVGESCSGECRDDLFCQGGICAVKQNLGQTCGFDLPCASGLTCNGTVCEQGQPLVCGGGLFF